ncbi:MAG TPA: RluA family pseudouridine synthase [Caulobacteraceae bacterium]|jgi:tRNA pseudouridine32 synthase/23S rRNA pseudouridine746 synthase|nr:RluA family pseudouridine synthase [Caulobacteraceae bacterium]
MAERAARAGARLSADEIAFVRGLVIFEDADILALDKPPGLSSQGGRIAVATLDELLAAFAKPSGVKPRLVHRLDRDTSGIILAARSQPAAAFLGKAMMARRFRKTYLAIVAPGAPRPVSGVIEAPLIRQDIGREAFIRLAAPGEAGAQAALTRYRTLEADAVRALVELAPRTGRMHQLRVHLASIGRPIAGDARYGGALALGGRPVPRLMLHAQALAFPHPAGGDLRIEAPMPADMAALAESIGR